MTWTPHLREEIRALFAASSVLPPRHGMRVFIAFGRAPQRYDAETGAAERERIRERMAADPAYAEERRRKQREYMREYNRRRDGRS